MKFSLCQVIAVVCILAVGFMGITQFTHRAEAQVNVECLMAGALLSFYYTMVMYYCYSGEVYDPEACDFWWGKLGEQYERVEEACG